MQLIEPRRVFRPPVRWSVGPINGWACRTHNVLSYLYPICTVYTRLLYATTTKDVAACIRDWLTKRTKLSYNIYILCLMCVHINITLHVWIKHAFSRQHPAYKKWVRMKGRSSYPYSLYMIFVMIIKCILYFVYRNTKWII